MKESILRTCHLLGEMGGGSVLLYIDTDQTCYIGRRLTTWAHRGERVLFIIDFEPLDDFPLNISVNHSFVYKILILHFAMKTSQSFVKHWVSNVAKHHLKFQTFQIRHFVSFSAPVKWLSN